MRLLIVLALVLAACASEPPAPAAPGAAATPAPGKAPAPPAGYDPADLDLSAMLKETQIFHATQQAMRLVWWIPVEYWETVFAMQGSNVTPAQSQIMLDALRPFALFSVMHADVGPAGALAFATEDEVRATLTLSTPTGRQQPLTEEEIPPAVKGLLSGMRPAIASAAGEMGENMHLFVFDNRSGAGGATISPRREGFVELVLAGEPFRWSLPLGSFLPPKRCPIDQQPMNGAWSFCPHHGVRLE